MFILFFVFFILFYLGGRFIVVFSVVVMLGVVFVIVFVGCEVYIYIDLYFVFFDVIMGFVEYLYFECL